MSTTPNPEDQRAAWIAAAHEMGCEHARNAASWVADGNTSEDSIRRLLTMLDDGDPEAEDHLPQRPNLSGEWADDLTPLALAESVIGYSISERTEAAWLEVIDELSDAYESGVDETFSEACESELRRWVSA